MKCMRKQEQLKGCVDMKLTYRLIDLEELNSMERLLLKARNESFGFLYIMGTLKINKQLPHISEIVEAVKALWEVKYLDDIGDSLHYKLVSLIGEALTNQLFTAWHHARDSRSKVEAEATASAWLDQVFQTTTLDEWETIQGYDEGLINALASVVLRKRRAGQEGYTDSNAEHKALFLYAYRCGEAAALQNNPATVARGIDKRARFGLY